MPAIRSIGAPQPLRVADPASGRGARCTGWARSRCWLTEVFLPAIATSNSTARPDKLHRYQGACASQGIERFRQFVRQQVRVPAGDPAMDRSSGAVVPGPDPTVSRR